MIRLFPTVKTKKQIPLNKFLLVFFVCASVVTWIGISTIFADEDDPVDNTQASFQNDAQAQHANNVAILAALKHPDVIEAKENQDADLAKIIDATIAKITDEISEKRAEGMGWGNIAKFYKVHPKYLGLGHSSYVSTQLGRKSKIKAARSYKGDSMKGHGMSDSASNGKKFGLSKKKLVSQAYSGQYNNRGLALGHSKGNGGGHGHSNGGGKGGGKNK